MTIRLSSLIHDSIVDGEGLRSVIFTQGCPHNCPGCHNQSTIPFDGGTILDIQTVIDDILKRDLKRVTFSGGEPFVQAESCYYIAVALKKHGYNLWSYTGYTMDALLRHRDPYVRKFLEQIEILIDGRFILAQRSLQTLFRGSTNQRIIDVPASLEKNAPVVATRFKDPELNIPKAKEKDKGIFI
ncbi:ribonucleoside-triphosphate reductase activating protein [Erysipelothrix larvae]|uniref:Anaerobic ribonucleoside-triphosphate reductase-activating protein n=1 Tax=Erysipelothrix larvae TaxID=1514105 RepID=A0A0X8GYI3_9FIRM|nr:4Fe-4S single cluster domain-containing protein [Erysipelothrix larvae]AMC92765.1 ribonucleoside-triphosphate reductase activating protein [Erysipelothrix larvae]